MTNSPELARSRVPPSGRLGMATVRRRASWPWQRCRMLPVVGTCRAG